MGIFWTLFISLSLLYFFRWVAYCASSWLQVAFRWPSPRLFSLGGVVVSSLVLSVWFGLTFLMLYLLDNPTPSPALIPVVLFGAVTMVILSPVTMLVFAVVLAYPLIALLLTSRYPASPAGWAFLDPTEPGSIPVTAASPPRLRLRTALIPAAVLSVIYSILVVLIRLGLRLVLTEATRDQDSTKITLVLAFAVLAVIFGVIAGMWVTLRSGYARGLMGLLATFASGCCMAVGFLVGNLLLGGSIDVPFAASIFSYFINGSCLVALPLILFINWVRRFEPAASQAALPTISGD